MGIYILSTVRLPGLCDFFFLAFHKLMYRADYRNKLSHLRSDKGHKYGSIRSMKNFEILYVTNEGCYRAKNLLKNMYLRCLIHQRKLRPQGHCDVTFQKFDGINHDPINIYKLFGTSAKVKEWNKILRNQVT